MNTFKVGDRVRAVKDCDGGWFTIGQIGTVEGTNEHHIFVTFDNGREAPVKADEIELIQSEVTEQDKEWLSHKPTIAEPIDDEDIVGCRGYVSGEVVSSQRVNDKKYITVEADAYVFAGKNGATKMMADSSCKSNETISIDDIEATQPISKPFPTFEEFMDWVYKDAYQKDIYQNIYNYFAQFGVREVFPEVGKEYEFSEDGENWRRDTFESYESNNSIGFTHIRPIQPTRLEQLKARRSELSREELLELVELMEDK